MRNKIITASLAAALVVGLVPPAAARPNWKKRIDRAVGNRSMSVMVRDEGKVLYRHKPSTRRAPASSEKLLLSMALLDRLDPKMRFVTTAKSGPISGGVIKGNLWIAGKGDPTITGGGSYGRSLPFRPTRLGKLAHKIKDAGVRRIAGSVAGSTTYFSHDWWAPGWKSDFPSRYIPLPSALTFDGNRAKGKHISDPESRAARSLTKRLRSIGVKVKGTPRAGYIPQGLDVVATTSSVPLSTMMRFMNRRSSNFFAEVFGKRLAVEARGGVGTIANGAAAIEGWARSHGVDVIAHDSSGLSYDNRSSPAGFTRLLEVAEAEPWFGTLRSTLAGAGEGTLEHRLDGVKLRAKTGTLSYISSLSGWVWLRRTKSWASFSIMSNGLYKSTAASIEDGIVRELTRNAR